jgi:hypothetical protein
MPGEPWIKASIVRWSAARSLQELRREGKHRTPVFTLVHCTYCFNSIGKIIQKLVSFCHSEFAKEPFTNPNYILAAVKCGKGFIPAHADRIAPYTEDLDAIMPFRHPGLEFLRDEMGFRNVSGTTREEVAYFLRYLNCTKSEAFNWLW